MELPWCKSNFFTPKNAYLYIQVSEEASGVGDNKSLAPQGNYSYDSYATVL